MSAPTNVRVESIGITENVLNWSYAGASTIGVYRSTDGATYAWINESQMVAVGTTTFSDISVAAGTFYYYKLSDDSGSTYSSVVTVWTHTCITSNGMGSKPVTLPRFTDEEVSQLLGVTSSVPGFNVKVSENVRKMNDLADRVEAAFQGKDIAPDKCVACPVDGAVVIDCSSGCINWTVAADQDINSISILWCDKFDGTIEFVVPPNTTVGICGFPDGFGFTGDECYHSPISGGTTGRTVGVGYTGGNTASGAGGGAATGAGGKSTSSPTTQRSAGIGRGSGSAGGGGGSTRPCNCSAPGGVLTIVSCRAENSIACLGVKALAVTVCGGSPPYTWSHSGSVQLSADSGVDILVTPPANPGSGEAGHAWSRVGQYCTGGFNKLAVWLYGCNDNLISYATPLSTGGDDGSGCGDSVESSSPCNPASGPGTCSGGPCNGVAAWASDPLSAASLDTFACDTRTAPMIAAGCNPCGTSVDGETVTVTDSLGVNATIILAP